MIIRGWVLWRDELFCPPTWQYGDFTVEGGAVTFSPVSLGDQSGLADSRGVSSPAEMFVVPGFVDLHSHLAIGEGGALGAEAIRAAAWEEIRAGVLAIREPGSPVRVDDGDLPFRRPKVIRSGQHIALQKRYLRGIGVDLAAGSEREVEEALVAEVRRQAAAGDGWVKLVGDWIDRSGAENSDLLPLWSKAQLVAAVEAAHELGVRVSVHTFSSAAIPDLIAAGVDSIEHGSGMSKSDMMAAVQAGIPVVPTVAQVQKFPEFAAAAQKYPVYAETMTELYERRRQWFADLLRTGVELLPGSDAGGYQQHGSLVQELQVWVEWGMDASDVLAAATWKARDFLGLDSLSEGAPADALVFDSDPSASADVWGRPRAIIAAGNLVLP